MTRASSSRPTAASAINSPDGEITLAELVGEFAASIAFEDLPAPVVQRAKELSLDCVGLALVAARGDLGRVSGQALSSLGGTGNGTCTIISSDRRAAARDAAFANGLLVGALDWDDTHLEGAFHASASAFPASLAVTEEAGGSGADFLLGYVVSLEVAARVAAAARDGIHQAGFAPTGVATAFGSAAGAAQLMGLSAANNASAQGIVGSFAAGLLEFLEAGAWTKNVHGAWSAHCGVTAACLAAAGFKGPSTVYEGRHGLYQTHLRDPGNELRPRFFATLGREWEVLRIAGKRYPVCHFSQAFLNALFELEAHHGLVRGDIERVTCLVPEGAIATICEPADRRVRPLNAHDAQESLPFVLAAAILNGGFTEVQLADDVVHDPRVHEMARRISYEPYPDSKFPDSYDGELIVETADGATLHNRNFADNLDFAAIEAKFLDNAGRTIGVEAGARIEDAVMTLEDSGDIRSLTDLLGSRA